MTDAWPVIVPLPTRRATTHLAAALAHVVKGGDLLILSGELGAGKTFLVRAMARSLGLPEAVRVTSPTFNLASELHTTPPILHADLYRLTSLQEIEELGLVELRDRGALLVVEWGEEWIAALGGDALLISLQTEPRMARLRSTGPRSAMLLQEFQRDDLRLSRSARRPHG